MIPLQSFVSLAHFKHLVEDRYTYFYNLNKTNMYFLMRAKILLKKIDYPLNECLYKSNIAFMYIYRKKNIVNYILKGIRLLLS